MNPLFNPNPAAEGVFHRVRMWPGDGETRHISEVCDDAYWGKYSDFEWHSLAASPPTTVGVSETEEDDGEIWFTFRTLEPADAVGYVSRVAAKYPTLNIVHDYEDAPRELLGRIWYQGGEVYKECHLTPIPAPLRAV